MTVLLACTLDTKGKEPALVSACPNSAGVETLMVGAGSLGPP